MLRTVLLLALLPASPALSQTMNELSVFTSEDCTSSETTVAPGESFQLYVCLEMNGYRPPPESVCQSVGVQFRIVGIPDSWEVVPVPSPEAINVWEDDPMSEAGGEILVPIGDGSPVVLFSLMVEAAGEPEDVEVAVTGVDGSCPITVWLGGNCDGARLCVAGTTSAQVTVQGPTPVEPTTWSRIKTLYLQD